MSGWILFTLISASIVCFAAAMYSWYKKGYKQPLEDSYYTMTDKDLLMLIDSQPDKLISAEMVSNNTSLTKKEAKARLTNLIYKGVLKSSHASGFKYFYSLKQPIRPGPYPTLSNDPFLTVGDLMLLFKHFDYRVSIQDICMATGLPVSVIREEMKHFIKKEIVREVINAVSDGMTHYSSSRFYILRDPYRNNPDAYLEQEEAIDFELKEIYKQAGLREDR